MKPRSQLHISRKLYHVSGVSLILFIYWQVLGQTVWGIPLEQLAILVAAVVIVSVDFFRVRHLRLQKKLKIFERVMRDEEQEKLSSMSYLITGCSVVICFFPPAVVTLSLLILAVGDPISSIFGVLYGKDKILKSKTLQGTIAGFVACSVVAAAYFWSQGLMIERLLLVTLLTGIIGAAAELIPIGKMDDNFTIPVCSATLLSGLFYLFGGFAG